MAEKHKVISIILMIVAGIFVLLGLIVGARYVASVMHANNAESGQEPPVIMELGFPEGYVGEYAHGVASYQRQEYAQAEQYFAMAAQQTNAEPYDCDIRTNWALSICYQIDFEHLDDDQSREQAINRLLEASAILCEDGCAVWGRQGEWHDDEAQQLEDDIERMLMNLQSQQENQGDDEDQEQQPPESEEEKQQRQQKQQELEQQRSQAMSASQKERSYWEQGDGNPSYSGRSW